MKALLIDAVLFLEVFPGVLARILVESPLHDVLVVTPVAIRVGRVHPPPLRPNPPHSTSTPSTYTTLEKGLGIKELVELGM